MSWATVYLSSGGYGHDIDVDTNDDDYVYIKQHDDWVTLPRHKVGELIEALQKLPPPR